MKSTILAAGLIALGASSTMAQYSPYYKERHPYEPRHHNACQEKAVRLHDYERRAARDGHVDRHERKVIHALQADLDRACGGHRHR